MGFTFHLANCWLPNVIFFNSLFLSASDIFITFKKYLSILAEKYGLRWIIEVFMIFNHFQAWLHMH